MRVHGVGPAPCDWMLVGEGPGYREHQCGRPFVGDTGEELDRLLAANRLPSRKHIFLTNIYREYQGRDYKYTAEDLARDEPHLQKELQRIQPSLIITLGRHATRYFLGDVDMEGCWGLPWLLPEMAPYPCPPDGVVVFPVHHPAAGMHNPEMSPYVVAGFQALSSFTAGKLSARRLYDDPWKGKETYEDILSEFQLDTSLCRLTPGQLLAIDTEGWPWNPWSVQYSPEAGTGYLLRHTASEFLKRRFVDIVSRIRPRLVFHSSLHDRVMLDVLQMELQPLLVGDTMLMAYLLQIEPQGLKAGCLRHCNMRMQDYSDIVGDKANELTRDYLMWIVDAEQEKYEQRQVEEFERKQAAGRRVKVLPKLPKTLLHKAALRVMGSPRAHDLWEDQIEDIRVAAYNCLGDVPQATLDYVELETATTYGCRDADGTLRLHEVYSQKIDEMGLRDVYELELSTYPFIARMQKIGLKPDLDHFARLSMKLQGEIDRLRAELIETTGYPSFNANSGDQVADYLFGALGLEELKMTKGGRGSTNDKILEALEHEHSEIPSIGTIRSYREFYKLRNTFCVAPDTRLLTAALEWVPASTLAMGDKLLGFDEESPGIGHGKDHHRHWKLSDIFATKIARKNCYRLTFDDGTVVTCSSDHQWLARSAGMYAKAVWVPTCQLLATDRPAQTRHDYEIIKPLDMWESFDNFDAGYLSGAFDGEGCLQRPHYSIRIAFAQKPGPVMERIKQLLVAHGFHFSYSTGHDGCDHLTIARSAEVLRCLGTYRPLRLLNKFDSILDNLPRMNMSRTVKLVKREYLGEQDVIALKTSTHTFIAEGLASHNCDRLPDFVHRWPHDGRVHATFRTTRVVTGRLAASDPNVLAQPEHGQFAPEFKRGWVAEPGHVICGWDQSQIELRGLAHLSQDPLMLAIFRGEKRQPNGDMIDLHAATAERIFGVKPKDQDKHKHRLPAKAINFGIPMGMTSKGLSVELRKNGVDADEDTAQRWLNETLGLYPGVRRYMEQRKAEAARDGFVRCLSGRIRYIGGIRSKNERVREEAERFAFSTPIQESATWIMKMAEASIYDDILVPLWTQGVWVEPILQVHDCIKIECEEGLERDLHVMVSAAMTQVPNSFSVPLVVEGEFGQNMANMESF